VDLQSGGGVGYLVSTYGLRGVIDDVTGPGSCAQSTAIHPDHRNFAAEHLFGMSCAQKIMINLRRKGSKQGKHGMRPDVVGFGDHDRSGQHGSVRSTRSPRHWEDPRSCDKAAPW
jgi:hypothetical protein